MGCGNMKTFKAVRFQIVNEHGRIIEYELEDGVIINKEESGTGWLLEIVISNEHYETFKEYQDSEQLLIFVSSSRVQPMIQLYLNLL